MTFLDRKSKIPYVSGAAGPFAPRSEAAQPGAGQPGSGSHPPVTVDVAWREGLQQVLRKADKGDIFRRAGITPDPWQRDVLSSTAQRLILLCHRQSGKSTVTGALAAHLASHKKDALILLISPSQRQSIELMRKVIRFHAALGPEAPRSISDSVQELRLDNGARVIALPATEETIRGYSAVDLLVVDEASRVPDELYFSIRPMLGTSRGRLIALSTPFGKRGWFYEAWHNPKVGNWHPVKVTAEQCPRFLPSFLEEERQTMGDWWYSQEYLCNPPEAPIWMGDFSFRPIGDVKVGDEVIGWRMPKDKARVHLCRSVVEGVRRRQAEIVRVEMESGNVIRCTRDHRWLTMSVGSQDWFAAPRVGKRLVRVIRPTPPLPEARKWDAAWLGGMYDGEGCADFIAQCPNHNPLLYARIGTVLESLGLRGVEQPKGFLISSQEGGRSRKQALVNFVNWTRPTKIGKHFNDIILGASFRHPDRIVSIALEGWGDVVSMQTSTGNYVAWGYASKNCEFRETEDQLWRESDIQAAFRPIGIPDEPWLSGLPKLEPVRIPFMAKVA